MPRHRMHGLAMKWFRRRARRAAVTTAFGLCLAMTLFALAPAGQASTSGTDAATFHQTNLLSDIPGVAERTDPNLVNPWGLAAGPTTPLWVADNGPGLATIYQGGISGAPLTKVPLVVRVPGGAPTGQVYNASSAFVVHGSQGSGPATFLFSSEAGTITAWSKSVEPLTFARTVASVPGAIYKGLAIGATSTGHFLYAANFHAGTIDVFDGRFRLVHGMGFRDPSLPPGYAPFNVQNLGGKLFVTYAKQSRDRVDEIDGPGLGFVDVYTTSGALLRRLVSRGPLNAPWGLAIAPSGFGGLAGDLLVGNFGDGRIHVVNPSSGEVLGMLRREGGVPIVIDGLWGLRFGNGVAGSATSLLFSAGIAGEAHGLVGSIDPRP